MINTQYDCRPACICISQQMIMKSLLWNCVIEAQKLNSDPMAVASTSPDE